MSFYKDGLGIKLPTKVNMPLDKETNPNQKKKNADDILDFWKWIKRKMTIERKKNEKN